MDETTPLYNSRIISTYLEYLAKAYPEVAIAPLLAGAGITRAEVDDPGYWFNQRQVDAFARLLIERTGNPQIAREAGRYMGSAEGVGPLRVQVLGLLNLPTIYGVMGRLHDKVTRGATLTSRRLGPTTVELTARPRPGVAEKPFQCANRMGALESAAHTVTGRWPQMEHPECFHRGDSACRYRLTWERSPAARLSRLATWWALLAGPALIALLWLLPPTRWGLSALGGVGIELLLLWLAARARARELASKLQTQGSVGEEVFQELQQRYNDALLVQELGHSISDILDTHQLLSTVLPLIEKRLSFDRGVVLLADKDRAVLHHAAGFGYDEKVAALLQQTEFRLDADEPGIFASAFHQQQPITVRDVEDLGQRTTDFGVQLAKKAGIHSLVCVPMVHEKRSLGLIVLDKCHSRRPVIQSEVGLLSGIAAQIAVTIVNAESFRRLKESERQYRELVENAKTLEELSRTDGLTRVANRRWFDELLSIEFARAQRYQQPCSVLMIDLDHFKAVNDRHGHQVGDLVLQRIADALRAGARRYDYVARYGGEEFALLLPQTESAEARIVAERLRQRIAMLTVDLGGSAEALRISASVGVACWPAPGITSVKDLVRLADKALYRAKAQGRDRVVTHDAGATRSRADDSLR